MYKIIISLLCCYSLAFGQKGKNPEFLEIKKHDTQNLIPFMENELWGFLDKNTLKAVVKPTFSSASLFIDGKAMVEYKEKLFFLDKTGKLKYEPPSVATEKSEPKIVNKEGWNGFTFNSEKNYVTSYTDKYVFINPTTFVHKKINFAKVVAEKGEGIINDKGEIFTIFDFGKFMNIDYRMSSDKKHFLIIFSDQDKHFFAFDENEKKYDLGTYDDLFFSEGWNFETDNALINLQYVKAVKDEKVFLLI